MCPSILFVLFVEAGQSKLLLFGIRGDFGDIDINDFFFIQITLRL